MTDALEVLHGSVASVLASVYALREELTRVEDQGSLARQSLTAGVRRDVAIGLGGAVSEFLTGRRRLGQSVARTMVDEGRRARKHKGTKEARDRALNLVSQVQGLASVGLAAPIDWRFQRHINSGLAKVRGAKRPVTILDRLEGLLHEISAYAPPDDDISVIRRVDATFRDFITGCLERHAADWWTSRIPARVRVRAEAARRSGKSARNHPIQFLTLGDYRAVILEDANWREVFQPVLGDMGRFEVNLRRLQDLRNAVAHSRVLSTSDRIELRRLARDIIPGSY